MASAAGGEKKASTATWKHQKKLKFSYKEQKEYETIEDDIAALEEKLERWEYLEDLAAQIANQ